MDWPCDLDHEPAYRNDATEYFNAVDIADLFSERFHGRGPSSRTRTRLRILPPINHPLGLLLKRFH